MLIFCDFIQVNVFTTNHHLNLGALSDNMVSHVTGIHLQDHQYAVWTVK